MDHLTSEELQAVGFKHCGEHVWIDRSVRWFRPENVSLGDHVRIDCFCLMSAGDAGIFVGNYVHLAAGCYIYGGGGRVQLSDFSALSSKATIFTATDDFVDGWMSNPTVPEQYRKVRTGAVTLGRHVVVGSGSVVLPGVSLPDGCSVGALAVVKRSGMPGEILVGNPAKPLPIARNIQRLGQLEAEFRQELLRNEGTDE